MLRPGGRLVFLANSPLVILCALEDPEGTSETLQRPQHGMHKIAWADGGVEFHLGHGDMLRVLRETGFEVEALVELFAPEGAEDARVLRVRHGRLGAEVAGRGDMGSAQARLTLASTSPQRRAILEQLAIPFDVVAPGYVEEDPPDADPTELVRRHAEGKARSAHADGRVTLGVDTTVVLDRRVYGKAASAQDARHMLQELSGRTHTVVSGLCLLGAGDDVIAHDRRT